MLFVAFCSAVYPMENVPTFQTHDVPDQEVFRVSGSLITGDHAGENGLGCRKWLLSHVQVISAQFTSMWASGVGWMYGGGGAILTKSSTVEIIDSSFINGTAIVGGAICAVDSDVVITARQNMCVLFDQCSSWFTGGALYMVDKEIPTTLSITKAVFQNCSARTYSGACFCEKVVDIFVDQSMFEACHADVCAGAFGLISSRSYFLKCKFYNNHCSVKNELKFDRRYPKGGGAILLTMNDESSEVDMVTEQCCFIGNQCFTPIENNTIHNLGFDILLSGVSKTLIYHSYDDRFFGTKELSLGLYRIDAITRSYRTLFASGSLDIYNSNGHCSGDDVKTTDQVVHFLAPQEEETLFENSYQFTDITEVSNPQNTVPLWIPETEMAEYIAPARTTPIGRTNRKLPEVTATQIFSETRVFSCSADFDSTKVFSETHQFANSGTFSTSVEFSHSTYFEATEMIIHTREFTGSRVFSFSNHFTCSQNTEIASFDETLEFLSKANSNSMTESSSIDRGSLDDISTIRSNGWIIILGISVGLLVVAIILTLIITSLRNNDESSHNFANESVIEHVRCSFDLSFHFSNPLFVESAYAWKCDDPFHSDFEEIASTVDIFGNKSYESSVL